MQFIKLGCLWNSAKKDKNGKVYMSGKVTDVDAVSLVKGDKIFIFRRESWGPKSPVATLVLGKSEEERIPIEGPDASVEEGSHEPDKDDEEAPF